MSMSTHKIEIIEIGEVLPHPNADLLEITHIWGWQCCIGKWQFKTGDKAVYVPPDFCVPLSRPEFAFLKKVDGKTQERIRVRRFRGHLSQGLLISIPPELSGLPVGENVIEQLGIERYEPPIPKSTYGQYVSAPSGLYCPKFDVENFQRYHRLFVPGEPVAITEKIHGGNSRFCLAKNKDDQVVQFCGSRTNWMEEDEKNIWWMSFRQNPAIGDWCQKNPEKILYGEVFGQVQSLKYGAKTNDIFFVAFAILDKQRWLDFQEFLDSVNSIPGLKTPPLLYRGPFDLAIAEKLAEGDSQWPGANHMAEGVVVLPEHERFDSEIGRVMLKLVSNRYLEKS